GENLVQEPFGLFSFAHIAVRLSEPGHSIERGRIQVKASAIGISGELILSVEPRRIPQEKPELRIVGSGLRGALSVVNGGTVIPIFQRLFSGTSQTCVLNIRSPAQRSVGRRGLN